jgi:ATP-dependent DNA ligase
LDAPALWDAWVGMGGEGIVLKERLSLYPPPGVRSPAWLKLKPKLSLDVVVTGGSAERIRWSDWGEAVMGAPAPPEPLAQARQNGDLARGLRDPLLKHA